MAVPSSASSASSSSSSSTKTVGLQVVDIIDDLKKRETPRDPTKCFFLPDCDAPHVITCNLCLTPVCAKHFANHHGRHKFTCGTCNKPLCFSMYIGKDDLCILCRLKSALKAIDEADSYKDEVPEQKLPEHLREKDEEPKANNNE